MDDYVRRYIVEEVSDRNAVTRALSRGRVGKAYSFLPADEGVGRADLWPELTEGKLENATNFNFMATLRGGSSIPIETTNGATTQRRATSAGAARNYHGALYEACRRPQWNRDTRHIEHGEDPLQKCLRESLRSKGYHRDYEAAKRDADSLRKVEVERLRRKREEQEYVTRQLEQQRFLSQQWQEVLVLEKTKRDTLLRGERTIRAKFESEFKKTVSLVVELTEFNQRKRLFKLAMHQLDELKVLEREEFLEHQLFQKMQKQREVEDARRQQAAEARRRQADERMKLTHALMTEEISSRDKIVRWAVQKLVEYSQFELEGRDNLLRREIMESIKYEEALQRQLVADTRDRYFRDLKEAAHLNHSNIDDRQQRSRNAQLEKLRSEELERIRQRHDRQSVELKQLEVLERSDTVTGAQKGFSSLMADFLRGVQILRTKEQELKARLLVSDDEVKARQTLHKTSNDLSNQAMEHAQRRARTLEDQRREQEEHRIKLLREGEAETKRILELRQKVERQNKPFLGVTLAERTDPTTVLLVESLYVDGPCDAAGIRIGDIIVSVGDVPVNSFSTMREAINAHAKMGERLSVVVQRDDKAVGTSIQVLTADKEFSELKDIYFDTERHGRHKREEPSPVKPDKSSQSSTPTSSPGKPPLSRHSPRR